MKDFGIEIQAFHTYIMAKNDSVNTAIAYSGAVKVFLNHFKIRPTDITATMIIDYLNTIPNLHTRRNSHNAIKMYYRSKGRSDISRKFRRIPYPKAPEKLPTPVTKEEFIRMLSVTENIKHKCILMLGFDCGLRVSEVVNLKLSNINYETMQIRIEQSKGKKDRVVKLSNILKSFLLQYISDFKPVNWVFNGQQKRGSSAIVQYADRSCQEIVKAAAYKSGIVRNVTFHQQRHGFAVSLLDNGSSIEDIKERLGHSSTSTTRIYAPLSNKEIQKTESPLEQILMGKYDKSIIQANVKFLGH